MTRAVGRTGVFYAGLTLALLAQGSWLQVLNASAHRDSSHNARTAITRFSQPGGDISVAGRAVTGSQETGGRLAYRRTYTDGPLYAAVTGYASQAYGSTQLEGIYSDLLAGTDASRLNPLEAMVGARRPGNVATTIDPQVQQAAYDALQGRTGAAVALDPATGRVLAMVSTPSYDPASFAGSGAADRTAWQKLLDDPREPLLNRVLRATYPPGSTFKLVTAAAALENGLYTSIDQATDSPYPYTLPGTRTVLPNDIPSAPCRNASIRVALQYSCNTVFAKMAADLGEQKMKEQAHKFGFDTDDLTIPVRAAASVYPTEMEASQVALTGIGQFSVTATPLQMAMVSAAIANDGKLVRPTMVAEAGAKVAPAAPVQVVSPDTARALQNAMRTVVTSGTAKNASIPGLTVGGKTGTAQHGVDNSGLPYAWFTSYAKDGSDNTVAVAAIVEDGAANRNEISGSSLAAPIAKAVMKAALPTG
ncbi:peptidoglycan D,D-transpeptidase FtsI family protein [Kitasatospora sp. HPMI-4]|uniref:peptidoglycan D,D-transpeptidase FtsI family protein n=1 Tax=Kitasatospora sp. HPMI-4 TaxID=3448443 RepID=UPI003F1C0D8C